MRRKSHVRSEHVPTIYEMRAKAMQSAALARNSQERALFVAMAREVNRVLVRSDQQRRANFEEFRAVLESLA